MQKAQTEEELVDFKSPPTLLSCFRCPLPKAHKAEEATGKVHVIFFKQAVIQAFVEISFVSFAFTLGR